MNRQFIVRMLDVLWREPKMVCRYYLNSDTCKEKDSCSHKNIFMVDGRVGHGGMFDRLKGAISVYAISKIHQKDFRIHFSYPFELQKYLEPNKYDWRIDKGDIQYSFPHSRPLFLYGECYAPQRLFKNRKCEAHFYYGYDSLDIINVRYGTNYEWGQLYRELFKPTPYLQQYINYYQKDIGSDYIAIHTRFLNLLGDKVETTINPELPSSERMMLMEQIRDKIFGLAKQNDNMRVMLASDSMTFIDYMKKEMKDVYVIPGTVKHIDTAGHTDDTENLKMFLDYYMISGAKRVCSVLSEGMWPSAFPEYAAKISGSEFERIIL